MTPLLAQNGRQIGLRTNGTSASRKMTTKCPGLEGVTLWPRHTRRSWACFFHFRGTTRGSQARLESQRPSPSPYLYRLGSNSGLHNSLLDLKYAHNNGPLDTSRQANQPRVDIMHLAFLSMYKYPHRLILATPTAMQFQNTHGCADFYDYD
jgi:hypothetical protein